MSVEAIAAAGQVGIATLMVVALSGVALWWIRYGRPGNPNGKNNTMLREFMQGREQRIDRMLGALEVNNGILSGLAKDLNESVRDGREAHSRQMEALTKLLERLRGEQR